MLRFDRSPDNVKKSEGHGRWGESTDIPVPLYYRVYEDIRARIVTGDLHIGDPLPPERELEAQYKVSRTTIRAALRDLEQQGLIERKQGRGTIVTRPRIYRPLGGLTTLSEEINPLGLTTEVDQVEFARAAATVDVAQALEVASGSPVYWLRRRRLVSGDPVSVDESYLPEPFGARLTEQDLRAPSILQMLEQNHGIDLIEAQYRIDAVLPDHALAEALGIGTDVPVLVVCRTTYTGDGLPIIHAYLSYRADRVGYTAHVYRR